MTLFELDDLFDGLGEVMGKKGADCGHEYSPVPSVSATCAALGQGNEERIHVKINYLVLDKPCEVPVTDRKLQVASLSTLATQ